jgi:hypothetical protein
LQTRGSQLSVQRGRAAQALVVAAALALVLAAAHFDPAWLYAHALPEYFQPRSEQLTNLARARVALLVAAALLLVFVRPWFGRLMVGRTWGRLALDVAPSLLAVVLAIGASELILERISWRATHQAPADREPLRRWDQTLGWVNVPSRVGRQALGGRTVEYAFDADGRRVARLGDQVDTAAPAVLFVGESILNGHGLNWPETIPARVQADTGVQAAVLAVGGYATDQEYLRLKTALPAFRQPKAVVILFIPSLIHRVLDTDRPHLDRGLVLEPPEEGLRLRQTLRRATPLHRRETIARGVEITAETLRASVDLARARGAAPLILVPQMTPDTAEEAALRRRVLDDQGLPYIHVIVDPAFHLPNNRHPDPRGAAVIARAVSAYLIAHGVGPGERPRGSDTQMPGGS